MLSLSMIGVEFYDVYYVLLIGTALAIGLIALGHAMPGGGVFLVDGPICAGKSTLITQYCRGEKRLEEVDEEQHAAFLANPKKNALQFELSMARARTNLLHQLRTASAVCDRIWVDRSALGGAAFALHNFVFGHMSAESYERYVRKARPLEEFVDFLSAAPAHALLLPVAAVDAEKRCVARGGNDAKTSLEYLRGVTVMHYFIFAALLQSERAGVAQRVKVLQPIAHMRARWAFEDLDYTRDAAEVYSDTATREAHWWRLWPGAAARLRKVLAYISIAVEAPVGRLHDLLHTDIMDANPYVCECESLATVLDLAREV